MAGLRWLGAVLVAVVIAGARPAVAAPDDDPAREAFEQARRAYNLGRWQEAADGFERAYRLLGDPVLLFDRGQALRRAAAPTRPSPATTPTCASAPTPPTAPRWRPTSGPWS